MNDRFKFRVWDKEKNLMAKVMILNHPMWVRAYIPDGKKYDFYDEGCGDYVLHDYVLQQCTGMKDWNMNLIFEGDLVVSDEQEDGDVWIIQWDYDEGMYRCVALEGTKSNFLGYTAFNYKIVGNIFEGKDED